MPFLQSICKSPLLLVFTVSLVSVFPLDFSPDRCQVGFPVSGIPQHFTQGWAHRNAQYLIAARLIKLNEQTAAAEGAGTVLLTNLFASFHMLDNCLVSKQVNE